MKAKSLIFVIVLISLFLFPSYSMGQEKLGTIDISSWTNVCPNPDIPYCENIGKTAYNAFGPKTLRDVKLGKIIGVAWRSKGSVIGYSKPIPEAGLPGETRLSPRDAYYYIIDDGMVDAQGRKNPPFLCQCQEINAK